MSESGDTFLPGDVWKRADSLIPMISYKIMAADPVRHPGKVKLVVQAGCISGPWEFRDPGDTHKFYLHERNGVVYSG
jgi:hypothetical protein